LSIDVEDVEDDNLDIYLPAIRTMSVQVANWKAQQVFKALEANGLGYDEKQLFATDHQEAGANVSNFQAGAGAAWYLLDLSKPIKPILWGERVAPSIKAKTADSDDNVFWRDELVWGARARGGAGYGLWQMAFKSKAALTGPNFEAAEQWLRARRDEEGETLDIAPTMLLVPPALAWDARRLFGPATIEGSDNIYQGAIPFTVSNRLTGA
jgi:phage major head subunit gpT-like protein